MKIRNFIFGIALICAICFTSCSDGSSSSDSNETSSRVLDLRIKKNGVVHNSSRSIENAAEITQTDHVKATAVSGGIQFEIALPSDASYLEIRRLEDIEGMEDFWTTRCEPQNILEYAGKTYTFVYPLCEPGEKYKFNIGMETTENGIMKPIPEEIIIITATDGIGDIDYSNLKSRHIDLSYDGTKPTVKVLNVIPPEGDNVGTRIAYYAKNSSTETDWNNDVIWFGNYFGKESDTVSSTKLHEAKDYTSLDNPVYCSEAKNQNQELLAKGFSHFLESTNKSYLFAQYAYTFEVNEMKNPERYVWRTAILDSEAIKIK
ncbi:MAG: hypothetical protein PUI64_10325 [Treponema succinifaciens]|uniref:hypothetical protein n=1 Tax=Treponema succinifaciens TaxID=167 RepID=UPI0023F08E93|nr:hypothetical protein [Treponema succinifaciens]MDD6963272.1 hypothetical protein [Treponema succinifaciens]MDY5116940.1 hypothetical protein [Treponema succinifaciens]